MAQVFGMTTRLRSPGKIQRLIVDLGGMINQIGTGVKAIDERVADDWWTRMRINAPYDTGKLHNSIVKEQIGKRWFIGIEPGVQATGAWGSKVPYWMVNEFGMKTRRRVFFARPGQFAGTSETFRPDVARWAHAHNKAVTSKSGWQWMVIGGAGTKLGRENAFISRTGREMVPILESARVEARVLIRQNLRRAAD